MGIAAERRRQPIETLTAVLSCQFSVVSSQFSVKTRIFTNVSGVEFWTCQR